MRSSAKSKDPNKVEALRESHGEAPRFTRMIVG
jgi:hypothetical protein